MQIAIELTGIAGEYMEDATILHWLKSVGDSVTEGEAVVLVETAKVNAEVPAPASGVLVEILAEVDEDVPMGATLGWIDPQ